MVGEGDPEAVRVLLTEGEEVEEGVLLADPEVPRGTPALKR